MEEAEEVRVHEVEGARRRPQAGVRVRLEVRVHEVEAKARVQVEVPARAPGAAQAPEEAPPVEAP